MGRKAANLIAKIWASEVNEPETHKKQAATLRKQEKALRAKAKREEDPVEARLINEHADRVEGLIELVDKKLAALRPDDQPQPVQ